MQEQEGGAAVRNILRRRGKEELTLKLQKSGTQSYLTDFASELPSKRDRARHESRSDFFVMGMFTPAVSTNTIASS
jgi:hypothetical protein